VPAIGKSVIFVVRCLHPFMLFGHRTEDETFRCDCCGEHYELSEVSHWGLPPALPISLPPFAAKRLEGRK
jgi:hypothetical protein